MTGFSFNQDEDDKDFASNDWFSLENTVGMGRSNSRQDVFKVESLLANAGDLDTSHTEGPTGFGLYTVDQAVRKYQVRNGLKVDGWLRPEGPTITKLKDQLGGKLAGYPAPSIDQLEAHRAAVQKGEPGLLNMKLPDVSLKPLNIVADSKTHGSNGSWVNWLLQNRGGYDEAPAMLATYIKNFGMEGVANARDFVEQWDTLKPGDGTNAIRAILSHLPDDATRQAFVGGALPEGPPIGTLKPQTITPQTSEPIDEPLVEHNWIYDRTTGMARLADDQPPRTIQVAQAARSTMTDAVNDGALLDGAQPQQVAQAEASAETPKREPLGPDRATIVDDYDKFRSQTAESGQHFGESKECVALVKHAVPELGQTRNWRAGEQLKAVDGPVLKPGTAVATFEKDPASGELRYMSRSSGNHAGIFDRVGEQNGRPGVFILDQYNTDRTGRPTDGAAKVRFYPFERPPGQRGYSAGQFYVIKPAQ